MNHKKKNRTLDSKTLVRLQELVDLALVLVSHALNTTANSNRDEHDNHSDSSALDSVHSKTDAVNSSRTLPGNLFSDNLSAQGTADAVVGGNALASQRATSLGTKAFWLIALFSEPVILAGGCWTFSSCLVASCIAFAVAADVVTVFAPVTVSDTLGSGGDTENGESSKDCEFHGRDIY